MRALALIDRAWPALPLALLALTALVAGVGVLAAPAPTEPERIAGTVRHFAAAVQERRGADACADLTPAARQAVAARVGTLDCAATIGSFGFGLDAGPLRSARVSGAQITGDRATVTGQQLLAGGVPYGTPVTFERLRGRWHIASVGSGLAPR